MKKLTKKQMSILTKKDKQEPKTIDWKGVEILIDTETDFVGYLYGIRNLASIIGENLEDSHFYPSLDILADSFIVENYTNISTPEGMQDTFRLIMDMRKDGILDYIYQSIEYPKKDKLMSDLNSYLNHMEQVDIRKSSNGLVELSETINLVSKPLMDIVGGLSNAEVEEFIKNLKEQ